MNPQPRYRMGDLELDVGRGRVMRGDAEIALPKLSFDLLLALVRAAPNLLSIDELMTQVWPGMVVSPETVTHRVKALRDALGDDPKVPKYIAGLRGRGYQLIVPVELLMQGAEAASAPTIAQPPSHSSPSRVAHLVRPLRIVAWVTALAAVAAAALALWSTRPHPAGSVETVVPDRSVAILPFVDLSEKQDQAYFADGMAQELLTLLARIPGLKVIGRTSSFQFKGKTEDLRRIGEVLGAAHVVEGSVRRSGNRIRVSIELIDTRDGAHRWSEEYDREATDSFELQRDIAANVARALQVEIAPAFLAQARVTPKSSAAYDLYLHGLHDADRADPLGFEMAVVGLRRSLELDPGFVPAAEALAASLANQAGWGFVPAEPGWERARAAANAALKLDPNSATAHAILGDVFVEHDWNWSAAQRELATAVSLAPRDPVVLRVAARGAQAVGDFTAALNLLDIAASTDPLDPDLNSAFCWYYLRVNRLADAEAKCRRTLEISPTFVFAHESLGVALLLQGKLEPALEEMKKEVDPGFRQFGLAMVYQALHRQADADLALKQLEAEHAKDWPMYIAEVYAARHEFDDAFRWLEQALVRRDITLYLIKGEVLLDPLKVDPRWAAYLNKMNLPP
jgi:TolB-like protein/DNA-binding winged helix-turn-helix (wHTH) protein/Flp pilus assembly protein TadD